MLEVVRQQSSCECGHEVDFFNNPLYKKSLSRQLIIDRVIELPGQAKLLALELQLMYAEPLEARPFVRNGAQRCHNVVDVFPRRRIVGALFLRRVCRERIVKADRVNIRRKRITTGFDGLLRFAARNFRIWLMTGLSVDGVRTRGSSIRLGMMWLRGRAHECPQRNATFSTPSLVQLFPNNFDVPNSIIFVPFSPFDDSRTSFKDRGTSRRPCRLRRRCRRRLACPNSWRRRYMRCHLLLYSLAFPAPPPQGPSLIGLCCDLCALAPSPRRVGGGRRRYAFTTSLEQQYTRVLGPPQTPISPSRRPSRRRARRRRPGRRRRRPAACASPCGRA